MKINKNELIKNILIAVGVLAVFFSLFYFDRFAVVFFGLLSLNMVIIIHEAGHYFVARKSGVDVLVFSVGMGPRLFGVKKNGIDYRVSLLPIGGYVRMAGESLFEEALQKNDRKILETPGSLFYVNNFKRILIAVAGAAFNLISAMIFFFLASMVGTSAPDTTHIAPLSAFITTAEYSADTSGLINGDRAIRSGTTEFKSFNDIASLIHSTEGNSFPLTVERDGSEVNLDIRLFDSKEGKKAGICPISSTDVTHVKRDSQAWKIGMRKNSKITSFNNIPITHFSAYFFNEALKIGSVDITWTIKGEEKSATIPMGTPINKLGISLKPYLLKQGREGILPALKSGLIDPWEIIYLNFKGLFEIVSNKDQKLSQNVAGIFSITTGIGLATTEGFQLSFLYGLGNFMFLSALISSILAIMNLLPIPALDGGMILFSTIEAIRRKRFQPKTFFRYQFIGFFVIILLSVAVVMIDFNNFFIK